MNDIDKMPSKCHDCPYWEACDYPYICPDVGKDQTSRENDKKIAGYSQDTISRQAAIDEAFEIIIDGQKFEVVQVETLMGLPSAQPNHNAEVGKMEIVHCKDCKHWNLQVGSVKGDGLGSCDFHNASLVTGEGFCYWADRRGEEE